MASSFHVRAGLCTAAVMVFFAALATGDLPAWMLQGPSMERGGRPTFSLPRGGQTVSGPAEAIGPVLSLDCDGVGREPGASAYTFRPPCAGRSIAPNRRWGVEAIADTGAVRLAGPDGRTIDDIATLADAMPFVLEWSPRSDWFFVNHSLGGGHERLRLFQIVNRSVVERSAPALNPSGSNSAAWSWFPSSVTLHRPRATAYSKAHRAMREHAPRVATLSETTTSSVMVFSRPL